MTHIVDDFAVSAAKEILDRGYGKPAVISADAALYAESAARAEARRFAHLAVEILRAIATGDYSAPTRASACEALRDRGLSDV
jgi:hypothetical protein